METSQWPWHFSLVVLRFVTAPRSVSRRRVGGAHPATGGDRSSPMDERDVAAVLSGDQLGRLTNDDLSERLDDLFRLKATVEGRIVELLGEVGRRQAFRDEGAVSTEAWTAERFAVSVPTARALTRVAERAWDLPGLTEALCVGEISFDKVRAVADIATPETERALARRASSCSVRELLELARSAREATRTTGDAAAKPDTRSLRFNDTFLTMTVQLPADSYSETRVRLETAAKAVPNDGETRWDQRLCDALLGLLRESDREGTSHGAGAGAGRWFVIAHVPLSVLTEKSELAAQLERGGFVNAETVRRIACDATVAVAVDDGVGRTMYEGRARRDPNAAQRREIWRRDRCCRFPGCTNATFADVHHVRPWTHDGRTDIDNLVLLCQHHHHLVHSTHWRLSGDANEELRFEGPARRVMTSRPSVLWTTVTGPPAPDQGRRAKPS